MRVAEMQELSLRDWIALTGREESPFGGEAQGLVWRRKERHIGVWNGDDELIAAGGVVLAQVDVAGETLDVVGVGGLIVKPEFRNQGLLRVVADPMARMAETLGPAHAMIFCRERLVDVYVGRDYRRITDPVTVDQPSGRITMPLVAMWRPLRPGATWPSGPVHVHGEPF